MNLEDEFLAVMATSDSLAELLPGGQYSAIGVGEISRQFTPDVFDNNQELQPCALVKMGTEVPFGPYPESARAIVQIFFYQRNATQDIDDAMAIVFPLLNYKKIGAGTWRIEYENAAWNQPDDVLNANMHIMRFAAIRLKQPFEGGS